MAMVHHSSFRARVKAVIAGLLLFSYMLNFGYLVKLNTY